MRTCAGVKGEQKTANASSMTAKADLVAASKHLSTNAMPLSTA